MNSRIITKDGPRDMDMTPLRAIRQKCLECVAWSAAEVRQCGMGDCALWVYRLGKNPDRAGVGRKGGNPALKTGKSISRRDLEKKRGLGVLSPCFSLCAVRTAPVRE